MTKKKFAIGPIERQMMVDIAQEWFEGAQENFDRDPATDATFQNEWGISTSRERETLRNLPGATQCPDQAWEMTTRHRGLFWGEDSDRPVRRERRGGRGRRGSGRR